MRVPRVGVLSLQGDMARHRGALSALGLDPVSVTLAADLCGLDALLMPGGESTAMLRLMEANGLRAPLERALGTLPVMGTCAGLILLAHPSDRLPFPSFGLLDVALERNGYGRQIDSFTERLTAPVLDGPFEGVFIRAPRIRRVGRAVTPVALRPDGEVVGVRAGRAAGLCFHPELTGDVRFHRWFLEEVAGLTLPRVAAAGGVGAPA